MCLKDELKGLLAFVVCGAAIWAFGGWVATDFCLRPVGELASGPSEEATTGYARIHAKDAAIWCLSGSLVAALLWIAYRTRPDDERFEPTCKLFPGMPGPDTIAELKVGCFGAVVGCVVGASLGAWILPRLALGGIAVPNPPGPRIAICAFVGLIATVFTLTIALSLVTGIFVRR